MAAEKMATEEAIALLGKTELFGALPSEVLQRLAENAGLRRYRKGDIVFAEGDRDDALFVIAQGRVKVFVTSEHGDEMMLVTLQAGETFGELALIDDGPHSASTETLEPTTLLLLHRGTLLELFQEIPALLDSMLRSLGQSLRRLTEQASDLVFLDLNGRVAKLLVGLADQRGKPDGDDIVLDLGLTQTDLASMVGGSRQSVNQILHHFESRGYVELERQRVVIKEIDLLRKRAGG